jgi:5-methylcytosine-specific restriction endonuclease McrA
MKTPEEKRQQRNEYMKKWRAANPERANELVRNSQAKNPEKYRQLQAQKYLRWKLEKPERLKEIQAKAQAKFNLKRPWLDYNHLASNKARMSKWVKANPERMRVIRQRAKAKRRGVVGYYTSAQWERLVRQYNNTCPSCRQTGVPLHADHIIPVVRGGTNWIWNIQPLCKPCNSRKHTSIVAFAIPRLFTQ